MFDARKPLFLRRRHEDAVDYQCGGGVPVAAINAENGRLWLGPLQVPSAGNVAFTASAPIFVIWFPVEI